MAKRKQVKNACVNCQKACKKCDDSRPCTRCVKYGVEASCVNSTRKERKRGVKRGPYNRRKEEDGETDANESSSGCSTSWMEESNFPGTFATISNSSSDGGAAANLGGLKIRIPQLGTTGHIRGGGLVLEGMSWSSNSNNNHTNTGHHTHGKEIVQRVNLLDPKPMRTVRNKNISYVEEQGIGFLRPIFPKDSTYLDALAIVCSDILEEWERADSILLKSPDASPRISASDMDLGSIVAFSGDGNVDSSTVSSHAKQSMMVLPSFDEVRSLIDSDRHLYSQTPVPRYLPTPPETPQTAMVSATSNIYLQSSPSISPGSTALIQSQPSPSSPALSNQKSLNLNQLGILAFLDHFRLVKPS